MQGQGENVHPAKSVGGMPATDDEIREKYLERAIRELNHFTRELQACDRCPRGSLMPVLGSGHPQADIFMLKHDPTPAEIEEGVASLRPRGHGADEVAQKARHRPARRLRHAVRQVPGARYGARRPRVRRPAGRGDRHRPAQAGRGDGPESLEILNELQLPLAREVVATPGEIQTLTPSIDALYTPSIDEALDEEQAKRAFWKAFRVLGDWYSDFPPTRGPLHE